MPGSSPANTASIRPLTTRPPTSSANGASTATGDAVRERAALERLLQRPQGVVGRDVGVRRARAGRRGRAATAARTGSRPTRGTRCRAGQPGPAGAAWAGRSPSPPPRARRWPASAGSPTRSRAGAPPARGRAARAPPPAGRRPARPTPGCGHVRRPTRRDRDRRGRPREGPAAAPATAATCGSDLAQARPGARGPVPAARPAAPRLPAPAGSRRPPRARAPSATTCPNPSRHAWCTVDRKPSGPRRVDWVGPHQCPETARPCSARVKATYASRWLSSSAEPGEHLPVLVVVLGPRALALPPGRTRGRTCSHRAAATARCWRWWATATDRDRRGRPPTRRRARRRRRTPDPWPCGRSAAARRPPGRPPRSSRSMSNRSASRSRARNAPRVSRPSSSVKSAARSRKACRACCCWAAASGEPSAASTSRPVTRMHPQDELRQRLADVATQVTQLPGHRLEPLDRLGGVAVEVAEVVERLGQRDRLDDVGARDGIVERGPDVVLAGAVPAARRGGRRGRRGRRGRAPRSRQRGPTASRTKAGLADGSWTSSSMLRRSMTAGWAMQCRRAHQLRGDAAPPQRRVDGDQVAHPSPPAPRCRSRTTARPAPRAAVGGLDLADDPLGLLRVRLEERAGHGPLALAVHACGQRLDTRMHRAQVRGRAVGHLEDGHTGAPVLGQRETSRARRRPPAGKCSGKSSMLSTLAPRQP